MTNLSGAPICLFQSKVFSLSLEAQEKEILIERQTKTRENQEF